MSDKASFTTITVLKFLQEINRAKIPFDVCNINPNSHSVIKLAKAPKLLAKDSASDSEVLFGNLILGGIGENQYLPVSLKIFKDDNTPNIQGLKYEVRMYEKILRDILEKNYSPNFIGYVGYGICRAENVKNGILPKESTAIDKRYFGAEKIWILITERAGNGAQFGLNGLFPVMFFDDIWKKPNADIKGLLLQVIYSLEVMARLRIMHSDLHTGNILVVEYPREINLLYIVGTEKFLVKSRYVAYIFDWDQGYAESLGENPILNQQGSVGTKNNVFNSRADLYTILCTVSTMISDEKIRSNSIVNRYRSMLTTTLKEQESVIPITKREAKEIEQFQPYENDVYRMSGAQLRSIVKSNSSLNSLNKVYFTLEDKGSKTHDYIQLYSWQKCRVASIDKDFPTPLEVLMTGFSQYELRDKGAEDNKDFFVYKLPDHSEPKSIFIDPVYQSRGREKIRGKPAFTKQKSGYVKTARNVRISPRNSDGQKCEECNEVKQSRFAVFPCGHKCCRECLEELHDGNENFSCLRCGEKVDDFEYE